MIELVFWLFWLYIGVVAVVVVVVVVVAVDFAVKMMFLQAKKKSIFKHVFCINLNEK